MNLEDKTTPMHIFNRCQKVNIYTSAGTPFFPHAYRCKMSLRVLNGFHHVAFKEAGNRLSRIRLHINERL